MKKYAFLLSTISLAGLVSCSTAKVRVLPGEDGVNQVVVRDIQRDDAEEEAVKAANKYCEARNREAVFSRNNTQYTGKMDEETRNTVRKASTAAMFLGGAGTIASNSTFVPGALLGSAGMVGHVMTSDRDYQASVSFRCR